MFDHVGPNVRDYVQSREFYERALEPLGWSVLAEWPDHGVCGLGDGERPVFWIHQREPYTTGMHVAFTSPDRATVDAFYAAALAAGGTDTALPACAGTTRTPTAPSFSTPTETTSRLSATRRSSRPETLGLFPDML